MPFNLAWIHLLKSSCIESRTMRMLFTMSCVLLAAAALLAVSGCAEESSNGPESLEDSLAKLEKARTEALWSKPGDKASQSGPGTSDVPQSGSFVVKVESSAGDYKIEVHRDWAPIGAERFYQLVKSGFYDDCRYFRVVPGFMVQFGISGDPAIQKKWDINITDDPVKESNKQGYVTFATSGPDSRTTQIFINFSDNSRLDRDGFAPFGQVIQGMDSVDAINSQHGESPQQGLIEREGNAYLQQKFPELDFVKKMSLVSETAPVLDAPKTSAESKSETP